MAYSLTDSGVSIRSGRGARAVEITLSFKEIEAWAKRMRKDTDQLWRLSYGRAVSGLKKKFIEEPMILDGGDSSDFSLDWMLEDGSVINEKFVEPQGTNGVRLYWLLCELADPIGREIPELEKNEQ